MHVRYQETLRARAICSMTFAIVALGCGSPNDNGSGVDGAPGSGGRAAQDGGAGGAGGADSGAASSGGRGPADGGGDAATGGRSVAGSGGAAGSTGDAGSDRGGTTDSGDAGGGSVTQLSAIPGQDPAAVTKAGPPITVVGPAFIKPLFDGNVMTTDPSGNIIVAYLRDAVTTTLTKFGPDLNLIWTATLARFRLGSSPLAVDGSGNIYVGGEDQTAFAPTPAVIAQYLADGTPGWRQTIGASMGTNTINSVAVGPEGKIFALGYSNRQLPGQPATAAGGGFMLAYGSDGTLLQARQTTSISIVHGRLHVDLFGNSVFLNNYTLMRVDPSFATVWASRYDGSATSIMPTNVAMLADGSALYDYEESVGIVKRDPASGAAIWKRALAVQTATLDAIEGETWKGQFVGTPIIFLTGESIYLAGTYSDTYMNGSSPPPAKMPGYVARLDLTGNQLWFRQFEKAPNPNVPNGLVGLRPTSLALCGPNKLVVYQAGFANNGGTLFLINTADGTGP